MTAHRLLSPHARALRQHLDALDHPQASRDARRALGLTRSEYARAITELRRRGIHSGQARPVNRAAA